VIRGAGIACGLLLLILGGMMCTPPRGRAASTSVQLTAKEFLYEPKEATAGAGEVVFVVKNAGAIEHNFVLLNAAQKKIAEIAVIEPGTTAEVKATVTPGTYAIVCTLPGHKEAGMVGTLRVPLIKGLGAAQVNRWLGLK
jgi:uncharacterized cupredoxin-like copper-binding protein